MNLFETLIRKTRFTYLRWISMHKANQTKKEILDDYRKYPSQDEEIHTAVQYLKEHSISIFEYPFQDKYIQKDVKVYTDKENGMQSLLRTDNLKMAVCTYHRQNDHEELARYFTAKRMKNETTPKYMLFFNLNDFKPPYFRRGLIRVTR